MKFESFGVVPSTANLIIFSSAENTKKIQKLFSALHLLFLLNQLKNEIPQDAILSQSDIATGEKQSKLYMNIS